MQHTARREWKLIEPVVNDLGYELVGVDYRSNTSPALLRVYIDREEGVSIDDCARISHQVGAVLDVEDPIQGAYRLEVSSPGLDRPLFRESDFVKYRGHMAKVKLSIPYEGRRNFKGQLNGVEDSMVLLIVDSEEFLLPYEQIERANLVPQFSKGEKKKF
ncbi:MAG: ribosome maturation factor RimP [Pseudomonadota bacterium]